MKNRGDRLYRKAQIRKRLIERAIREYNRFEPTLRSDGSYIEPISTKEELFRDDHNGIRRVLRNEGRNRKRIYPC